MIFASLQFCKTYDLVFFLEKELAHRKGGLGQLFLTKGRLHKTKSCFTTKIPLGRFIAVQ